MRKIKMLVVGVVVATVVSGCGSTSTSTSTESDAVNTVESDAVSEVSETIEASEVAATEDSTDEVGDVATEDAIKIEDIDWNVVAGIINGVSMPVFSYVNNSNYTIAEIDITFVQRDDVTDDDRSVFDDFVARKYPVYDESDKTDFDIRVYNRIVTEPGDEATQTPCYINGMYYAENMDQYNLMKPSTATIRYIAGDKKLYYIYYDFETEAYGTSPYGGEDSQQWSDSEIATSVPYPDSQVILVNTDEDDEFYYWAYGISYENFSSYVEDCKEAGFNDTSKEDTAYYEAYNSDGYLLRAEYSSVDQRISCKCKTE